MTASRVGWLILLLATAADLTSVPNGSAHDDQAIVPQNPVVNLVDLQEAAFGRQWPIANPLLAGHLLGRGAGRKGHVVALAGFARSEPDRPRRALLSESYLLQGGLPATERARWAANALEPKAAEEWRRMVEIQAGMGAGEDARQSRARPAAPERGRR